MILLASQGFATGFAPNRGDWTMDEPETELRPPLIRRPWLMKRRDQRPNWNYHKGSVPGFMRCQLDGIAATHCEANVVVLPFGQASPQKTYMGEHIIFQLQGELEFEHLGKRYLLEPFDLFFIPADISYKYRNVGQESVVFLAVIAKANEWPARVIYEE
jgi:quercetin dioxygenase-like cupin family protein